MEGRTYDDQSLDRKAVTVRGSFVPNGSSAIDNTQNRGRGWTVAYTTTGVYTVTFRSKYGVRLCAKAHLVQATRTQDVEVASCAPATGVMVLHGFARGGTTLADITAAAGTRIDFEVTFSEALTV